MKKPSEQEEEIYNTYIKVCEEMKVHIRDKVSKYGGTKVGWDAHAQGIHALVEVNTFLDSVIDHLETKSTGQPQMTMPDGSPLPPAVKAMMDGHNNANDTEGHVHGSYL